MSEKLRFFLTGNGVSFATGDGALFATGKKPPFSLITDRTQADVDRADTLRRKGWKVMTEEERAEFDSAMKGTYNASDLIRVESAVKYVADLLYRLPADLRAYADNLGVAWDAILNVPYNAANYTGLSIRMDWSLEEIPTESDLERYLRNVALIRDAFAGSYPTLPESMEKLTYAGANAIERVLELVYEAAENRKANTEKKMDNTAAAWFFSGDLFGGEV